MDDEGEGTAPGPREYAAMVQLLAGFQLSQALFVIVRLGVPDALAGGPRPLPELAAEVGADPVPLGRLLRALAPHGVFRLVAPQRYGLGPRGRTLVAGARGSMRDLALVWAQTHYDAFGRLHDATIAGVPAAELHYGEPFWSWLARDPARVATFTSAMAGLTHAAKVPLLAAYDLGDARLVVDVGGADGSVLVELLAGNGHTRGIVFDLPHVVPAADAVIERHGLGDRVGTVAGDFFTDMPAGADRYVLSSVLHDWSDDECVRILAAVAGAITADGRLLLVERMVPEGDDPDPGIIDLTMLAMVTGRERTETEWRGLLRRGGFEATRLVTAAGPFSLLEARPSGG